MNRGVRQVVRADIVRIARSWIGTPYHHQASVQGVGTDCLGLLRGIWRALYGREPGSLPSYSRDWAEASGRETLLEAARRYLDEVKWGDGRPGDVVLFRLKPEFPAKHVAILTSETSIIHAMEGAPVSEVPLVPWWRKRIAGVFSFPGVIG